MSDDLISRKSLLECAEYDDKGRLVIPYRKVKNAPTAFDKGSVIKELKSPYNYAIMAGKHVTTVDRAIEIVEKGGIE